jgi:hypothetical protein
VPLPRLLLPGVPLLPWLLRLRLLLLRLRWRRWRRHKRISEKLRVGKALDTALHRVVIVI